MANLNIKLSETKSLDLSKAPHTLIAGQTGSGKSVCINAILTSLIAQNSPKELQLILIDPKVVELLPYEDIPHLLFPIITETEKSKTALEFAVKEMEARYKKLALKGVRNIDSYNTLVSEKDILSKIVIVIDEFADLMMTSGKDKQVETLIVRLAQKARAIGIHLILATQRPSVNVITGILKANIPTRIAFQVASQIDSRTILDVGGGEKLKGKGEMLLKEVSSNELQNHQGIFVSDMEIENVVNEAIEKYEGISEVSKPSEIENNDTQNILDEVIRKCNERRARIQKILNY